VNLLSLGCVKGRPSLWADFYMLRTCRLVGQRPLLNLYFQIGWNPLARIAIRLSETCHQGQIGFSPMNNGQVTSAIRAV
jgi:hypothetical protein